MARSTRTQPTTRLSRTSIEWEDTNGDGQIVIGAEQWPECLNPITECANSSWYVWTTAFKVLPSVWATTSQGTYEATQLVTGEPDVALG